MSRSRAVGTCRYCDRPVIYRHWNGHRAWTHRETGNVSCLLYNSGPITSEFHVFSTLATPKEAGKFSTGEEP